MYTTSKKFHEVPGSTIRTPLHDSNPHEDVYYLILNFQEVLLPEKEMRQVGGFSQRGGLWVVRNPVFITIEAEEFGFGKKREEEREDVPKH
jgi:hypothetical protein